LLVRIWISSHRFANIQIIHCLRSFWILKLKFEILCFNCRNDYCVRNSTQFIIGIDFWDINLFRFFWRIWFCFVFLLYYFNIFIQLKIMFFHCIFIWFILLPKKNFNRWLFFPSCCISQNSILIFPILFLILLILYVMMILWCRLSCGNFRSISIWNLRIIISILLISYICCLLFNTQVIYLWCHIRINIILLWNTHFWWPVVTALWCISTILYPHWIVDSFY